VKKYRIEELQEADRSAGKRERGISSPGQEDPEWNRKDPGQDRCERDLAEPEELCPISDLPQAKPHPALLSAALIDPFGHSSGHGHSST
jgi:hypothetical protein